MRPFPQPDRHDAPWLADDPVPWMTAVINDIIVIAEHAIGSPIVAHELPDVFRHVQIGAFRRQRQQGDVGGHVDLAREVPSGLIEQQHRMLARADHTADFSQMQVHRCGVAEGQHQGRALALLRADSAKDIEQAVCLLNQNSRIGLFSDSSPALG